VLSGKMRRCSRRLRWRARACTCPMTSDRRRTWPIPIRCIAPCARRRRCASSGCRRAWCPGSTSRSMRGRCSGTPTSWPRCSGSRPSRRPRSATGPRPRSATSGCRPRSAGRIRRGRRGSEVRADGAHVSAAGAAVRADGAHVSAAAQRFEPMARTYPRRRRRIRRGAVVSVAFAWLRTVTTRLVWARTPAEGGRSCVRNRHRRHRSP
jgi:hypothetical protein